MNQKKKFLSYLFGFFILIFFLRCFLSHKSTSDISVEWKHIFLFSVDSIEQFWRLIQIITNQWFCPILKDEPRETNKKNPPSEIILWAQRDESDLNVISNFCLFGVFFFFFFLFSRFSFWVFFVLFFRVIFFLCLVNIGRNGHPFAIYFFVFCSYLLTCYRIIFLFIVLIQFSRISSRLLVQHASIHQIPRYVFDFKDKT